MYNTNFIVKYKQIEEELLLKFLQELERPLEYSKQDVFDICQGLYQFEILSVFGVSNIDDIGISTTILNLLSRMKENIEFMELFEIYKQKNIFMEEDILFASLFNYDLFHIFHQCICEITQKGFLEKETFERFKKNIL